MNISRIHSEIDDSRPTARPESPAISGRPRDAKIHITWDQVQYAILATGSVVGLFGYLALGV